MSTAEAAYRVISLEDLKRATNNANRATVWTQHFRNLLLWRCEELPQRARSFDGEWLVDFLATSHEQFDLLCGKISANVPAFVAVALARNGGLPTVSVDGEEYPSWHVAMLESPYRLFSLLQDAAEFVGEREAATAIAKRQWEKCCKQFSQPRLFRAYCDRVRESEVGSPQLLKRASNGMSREYPIAVVELESQLGRRLAGSNAAAVAAVPPETPSTQPISSGPYGIDAFAWNNTVYRGTNDGESMRSQVFALVQFLWRQPDKTSSFDELAQPIHKDRNHDVDENTIAGCRRDANTFFKTHGLPWRIKASPKNRRVSLEYAAD